MPESKENRGTTPGRSMTPRRDNTPGQDIGPERLEQLRLAAGAGPVLILTHDNPDPDALASGKVLATLLEQAWGIRSRLMYCGVVSRAENQAMLKLVTPGWEAVDTLDGLDDTGRYSAVALVDSQPGAGNNSLPSGVIPGIVIDHHNPPAPELSNVRFVDVRTHVGATVSLVYQYLEAAGLEPDEQLATAIFYGIQTDTRSLTRSSSPVDQRIYFQMLERIDRDLLVQVEQAGLPREYFQAFVRGLQAARVIGGVVVSYLGSIHRPDFAAELADILVRLQDARAVLCMGYHNSTLYLSMRISDPALDAGSLIQQVMVEGGHAGGHGMIAGGRVSLADNAPDVLAVEIERRFLQVMDEDGRPVETLL